MRIKRIIWDDIVLKIICHQQQQKSVAVDCLWNIIPPKPHKTTNFSGNGWKNCILTCMWSYLRKRIRHKMFSVEGRSSKCIVLMYCMFLTVTPLQRIDQGRHWMVLEAAQKVLVFTQFCKVRTVKGAISSYNTANVWRNIVKLMNCNQRLLNQKVFSSRYLTIWVRITSKIGVKYQM